ncbi:hypothetical protein [Lacrimispora brassicae]
MSLIYFQGLNCYSSSLLNAAVFTGADYRNVFANLWSETDFTYDQIHHLYLSRRMPANLETLGVKLEFLNCCSSKEVEKGLSLLSHGQWMVAGMDAFFIPWTPYYQELHSFHYFIAQKAKKGGFSCFDPTYDRKDIEITHEDMISHAFDICRIYKTAAKQSHISSRREAQEILYSHPITQENLLAQIRECAYGKQKNGELLAKYIDALINNCYLYVHYLQNMPLYREKCDQYFSKEFFLKWTTVKYGLYKASIRQNNQEIIQEVCGHFRELIEEEMDIAHKIGTVM